MLNVKNIHLIGIGGAGMTSLANILVEAGYQVSGSDIKSFSKSKELENKGVKIYIGHSPSNMNNADLVVFSSAIPESNVEMIEARKRGIPLFHRMDMIILMFREKNIIGISGTHGKTTTTAMISKMLVDNKIDASFYIGGESEDIPFGSHFGKDKYLVLETDEHDLSFLKIIPYIPVVLNVDRDHLSIDGPYKGDFSLLKDAFKKFIESSSSHKVILCLDDDFLKEYSKTTKTEVLSFSLKDKNATLLAKNIEINGLKTSCDIFLNGKNIGRLELKIPGEKNILNAMASFLVGYQLNLQPEEILFSLSKFKGTKRRFEILYNEKFTVIDDHADHPTEIEVTLKTVKEVFKDRRIILVLEPHRYSRVALLFKEYAESIKEADIIFLLPLDPADEREIAGINTGKIYIETKRFYPDKKIYYLESENVIKNLVNLIKKDDVIIFMGPGRIKNLAKEFLGEIK
ncbi:MAG: UDP-N-acetylmuramate--L-alanine ligase [Caldiserica bacterium]|nr:MAG: UDP-N-acetylmuramate--L-alanine ligase [Caldisericota bacterium]